MQKNLSIVISCIDYRFWPKSLPMLRKKFGDFDLIALAGASKNIVQPLNRRDPQTILRNIKLALKLHRAKTIILTNHLDCGAYGGSKKFKSYQEEIVFHKKELAQAAQIIKKKFPELKIKTTFLTKDAKNNIMFK